MEGLNLTNMNFIGTKIMFSHFPFIYSTKFYCLLTKFEEIMPFHCRKILTQALHNHK